MANETQFDGQFSGMGIAASIADSGDVTLPAASGVTATFAQVAGQQPSVARGKLILVVKNTTGTLGAVSLYTTDGTNKNWVGSIAAPAPGAAGQGCAYIVEWFEPMAKLTNVTAITANIAGATDGVARLRVLGGP